MTDLLRVQDDVAALAAALARLDRAQIDAQAAALTAWLTSTTQAADLAQLQLARAGGTADDAQLAALTTAAKAAAATAKSAAVEGRIIGRLIAARQSELEDQAAAAVPVAPPAEAPERVWSEISDRYLAVAREGGRVPSTADEAGTELHAATVRIKRMRPRSHSAVWEALERLVSEWPEAIRPGLPVCGREAAFAVQAAEAVPAGDGSAPRRKGRRQAVADADERGDQAPPATATLGDDDQFSAAAAEYRDLVRAWTAYVERAQVRPDANCGWLDLLHDGPADLGTDELRTRFVHQHQLRHARLRREDVASCVDATVADWRRERRLELLTRIIGNPAPDTDDGKAIQARGRAALRALIRAWTGAESELHIAVLAHWLWQVKRRAAGLGVEWDLMPVLVGPQGSGKTTEVDRLCAVLAELSVPVTAVQIVDQREAPLLARALAARWDEMSGASRADGDALKRAISMAQAAFRRLYSNDYEVRRRCVTFIGTSNFNLSVILSDTSGARRFAEIFVRQVDWSAAGQVDVRQVWDAVHELDPAPILEQLGALRDHQRTLIPRDLLHVWLEREADGGFGELKIFRADGEPLVIRALDPEPMLPDDQVDRPGGWTLDQIAARVAHFGRGFGRGTVQIERLGQRLRELGWSERQVRVGARKNNKRERRWFIDPVVRARLAAVDPDAADDEQPKEQCHGAM